MPIQPPGDGVLSLAVPPRWPGDPARFMPTDRRGREGLRARRTLAFESIGCAASERTESFLLRIGGKNSVLVPSLPAREPSTGGSALGRPQEEGPRLLRLGPRLRLGGALLLLVGSLPGVLRHPRPPVSRDCDGDRLSNHRAKPSRLDRIHANPLSEGLEWRPASRQGDRAEPPTRALTSDSCSPIWPR